MHTSFYQKASPSVNGEISEQLESIQPVAHVAGAVVSQEGSELDTTM